jgi:hypothetical protein
MLSPLRHLIPSKFLQPSALAYIKHDRTTHSTARRAMKSKIAICQICSTGDIEYNLRISGDIVRKAVAEGAQVRFLCLTILAVTLR